MPLGADRWTCDGYSVAAADRIARDCGLSPVTAAILARRGYETSAVVRDFLAAGERHDPLLLGNAAEACRLVLQHVERGSPIVVHGDYDVDGVCSTAVLVRALRGLGALPRWELPSRFDGGYGLSAATVERLAAQGAGLLVTTDCGITAVDEVELARARGIDVVVTDHHRPGERLPPCPVVHPGLGGYPFPELCATAVAYKLAEALYAAAGLDPVLAEEELDLVALATICDLVPLRGENRRLVREGLRALGRTARPGLRELMRVCRIPLAGEVPARAAGFALGPRLNAAGRMQRADAALELLLTEDGRRAEEIAVELDGLNRDRRETETRITFAAEAAAAAEMHRPVLVLADEDWHPGIIGIVASRMVERHHRPCVLVAVQNGAGRGSGRSIAPYDLHAGLAACSRHLSRFGGHRMAAGLEIETAAIDDFRRDLARHAAGELAVDDLRPVEHVDAVVPGGALGLELAEELLRLGPFGHGNAEPSLLVPAARLSGVAAMGDDGQHSRLTISNGGGRASAVAFRASAAALTRASTDPQDAVVRLELNEWKGVVEPRLVVRAVCLPRAGALEVLGEEPFWEVVERELTRPLGSGQEPTAGLAGARELRDRRGEGIAGVAGDLLSSGESVLLVCAQVPRRLAGFERVLGGLIPELPTQRPAAVCSWDALAAEPALASPFAHVLLVDPPGFRAGVALAVSAPREGEAGFVHLAWGRPETEFALAAAEAELDLRASLAETYRGLRDAAGVSLEELEVALRGPGARRSAAMGGRLLRVLEELELVSLATAPGAEPAYGVAPDPARTSLERSPAFVCYLELLAAARAELAASQRVVAAA
jgi:single-stranded-DNA-specific exonuclease